MRGLFFILFLIVVQGGVEAATSAVAPAILDLTNRSEGEFIVFNQNEFPAEFSLRSTAPNVFVFNPE